MGQELAAIMDEVRDPLQAVPPPRIAPQDVPAQVREKIKGLNALVTELQTKREKDFSEEIRGKILRARGDMGQSMSRQRWDEASRLADDTCAWLLRLLR